MRSARTWVLAAVVLLASAGAANPARGAATEPLTPPLALAPVDGATTPAGAPVTFRVQGEPDDLLAIRFSRSPAPVEQCGTIDDDVGIATPQPTDADASVYEAAPQVFSLFEFWLNRPGTYWWQVYRIHYGDGADGCIEAPPRSLTVVGLRDIEIGPQPIEPADGAVLPAGPISFRVGALATDQPDYLWVHVARSPAIGPAGVIGFDAELEALAQTQDPAVWSAAPQYLDAGTFWMNVPGTYWWQPHRISYFGDLDGKVEGPVRRFTIAAGPAPTVAPAPATPTLTIRGDEAFTRGTSNDLYLACTALDLYLVDVLPAAGGKVGVSGVADLRLAGKVVEILRDGRRVGTTTVGSAGGFAAFVAAPPKTRRATARYQARVGTTLSQSLKLERRMIAVELTRRGSTFTLSGRVAKPFARRPATIGIQRYRSCRRKDTVAVRAARPDRNGRFSVRFSVPQDGVRAVMYRATTKVATRTGGAAAARTYTLPRAIAR